METSKLKRFAQYARRILMEQVSNKLKHMLSQDSAARRENIKAVEELEKQIKTTSTEQTIEKVAYTWFNRFCAIRFMDVNRYTRINVLSPLPGAFQPEILAEAKMGHIDDEIVPEKTRQQITALLNGSAPSPDPQNEAYRLLIVAVCNYYHKSMPFLFERIADYTELLMPDDLLSGNSILAYTREAMTPDVCRDVEVIGWLYQFYISEKKDEVFEGLKKNKKITPENIPAATQLFTPNWIVRYLVENSLGRLWMLNRPQSKLIERMEYYIKPEQIETDFLRIKTPEEIRLCDPASGSGHMLVYAFDLLYAIYEEEGYEPSSIVEFILTKNLYGIEIDSRAGALAAFALTMKALHYDKRFLRRGSGTGKIVEPNICVLQNVKFDKKELHEYMNFIGRDLFTAQLETMLTQFEEADNFGSLIRPAVTDVSGMLSLLDAKDVTGDAFLGVTHEKVLIALKQADYLSPNYHIVVANPPYMGGKGMNGQLAAWVKENYPDSKSDFFAMFIERGFDLIPKLGYSAMVTMQSWMFLSSYERLREKLLTQTTIECMVHMSNMVMGIAFGTCATVWQKIYKTFWKGNFSYVDYEDLNEENIPNEFPVKNMRLKNASAEDFRKIPGSPIAYWVSDSLRSTFQKEQSLSSVFFSDGLTKTGNNEKYLRFHWEVSRKIASDPNQYRICVKGGDGRDYYGNIDVLVNWRPQTRAFYRADNVARITPDYLWSSSGISWTKISSKGPTFRWFGNGMIAETGGPAIFIHDNISEEYLLQGLGFLASKVSWEILTTLNPTLNFQTNDVLSLPFNSVNTKNSYNITIKLLGLSKSDWNSYETSWDFTELPLLSNELNKDEQILTTCDALLAKSYSSLREYWLQMTLETKRLEEENNRIFIEAYGLQDELTPEVPLKEITLTCNPHYRYGGDKTESDMEALLLADTMREFISYSVGCMFGRYSIDKPGLILANAGETIQDYLSQIPNPTFPADEDNVIPILDGDWFTDDITERFFKFLRITFGEEHFDENVRFIENAIGKDIRKYFLKDFYNDHVRRYKKRPIYWLFSSPKGSFNALIYMHRYRPDTVSTILNGYLREFRTKLVATKNHLEAVSISTTASAAEKTKALKETENIKKIIEETDVYERDILYPLATKQIEIDLDDGVKVNYQKFGTAVKKIPGLDSKEED